MPNPLLTRIATQTFAVLLLSSAHLASADQMPDSIHELVPTLQQWGREPTLVSAVQQSNASGQTLAQIQQINSEWQQTSGISPFMHHLMQNRAAKRMLALERSAPYFLELFLMNNLGANVAMTNKTSDYWQGDEAKFTASYHDGVGQVHIGDVQFDDSSQAYLIQVSVPVMDGERAIGALTIGINLDEYEPDH